MIVLIYGTRPEAIKLAPVIRALRTRDLPVRVICTGQHDSLLNRAGVAVEPDQNLGLMREDQTPEAFLARAIPALAPAISGATMVLVQGDTASALAGALAAFHARVPIGHVEAGLRTGDLSRPHPEEGYRILIDSLATRHYAPTETSRENLVREGHLYAIVTGNTSVDAVLEARGKGRSIARETAAPYAFATFHRREAFGEKLSAVYRAVRRIAAEGPPVYVAVHPNPAARTREELAGAPGVYLVEPLSYVDTIATVLGAAFVVTDSGGLQEEAVTLGVPVIVTREVTERPEGVLAGGARLVGFDEDEIVRAARDDVWVPRKMRTAYGDGRAGVRIAEDVAARMFWSR